MDEEEANSLIRAYLQENIPSAVEQKNGKIVVYFEDGALNFGSGRKYECKIESVEEVSNATIKQRDGSSKEIEGNILKIKIDSNNRYLTFYIREDKGDLQIDVMMQEKVAIVPNVKDMQADTTRKMPMRMR
ncbi:MAG: hypothetical protein WC492_02645 [Candidatus Micrarchaeia archaeon]